MGKKDKCMLQADDDRFCKRNVYRVVCEKKVTFIIYGHSRHVAAVLPERKESHQAADTIPARYGI